MFIYLYYASAIILIPGILFSLYAQIKINASYKKYSRRMASSQWVAGEMAQMLIEKKGLNVKVCQIHGNLTDNYNPTTQVLSLSQGVYSSASIAALAVSAHEVGHAVQHQEGYFMLKFRSFMVGVVNFGSRLALPLAIIGLLLTWTAQFYTFGEYLLAIGIFAYSLTAIFAFITLPVEINASNRAKKMLIENNVLTERELKGAKSVLSSAALTYVASLVISLLYLLRFILIIASLKRNRD